MSFDGELRDAEVEHLHGVGHGRVAEEKNVVGFDVAMHDARAMRGGERGENLCDHECGALRRDHLLAREERSERLATQQFHDEEWLVAILFGILKVRHLDDVWMTERGDDFGLATKTFELLAIFGESRIENFHRDAPPETFLDRCVHCAHSTSSERIGQAIATTEQVVHRRSI